MSSNSSKCLKKILFKIQREILLLKGQISKVEKRITEMFKRRFVENGEHNHHMSIRWKQTDSLQFTRNYKTK